MKHFFRILFSFVLTALFFVFTPLLASAHVVVRPQQVGIAASQNFTISVPAEKDNPTIGLRLLIPDGLDEVTPNVKPGWKIDIKMNGDTNNPKVTEIDWTNGSIPQGQRDEFIFQAQAPDKETTLVWKAYQQYQDGTVVSWDQTPQAAGSKTSDEEGTPYSTTKVINDLTQNSQLNHQDIIDKSENQQDTITKTAILFSIASLGISTLALHISRRKKN